MQALTKKRPTEKSRTMTIRLRGPRSKAKNVLSVARRHGFVEYEEQDSASVLKNSPTQRVGDKVSDGFTKEPHLRCTAKSTGNTKRKSHDSLF